MNKTKWVIKIKTEKNFSHKLHCWITECSGTVVKTMSKRIASFLKFYFSLFNVRTFRKIYICALKKLKSACFLKKALFPSLLKTVQTFPYYQLYNKKRIGSSKSNLQTSYLRLKICSTGRDTFGPLDINDVFQV